MERSETIGKLAGALVLAQGNLGEVRKTSLNPAFKSRYADLAMVVEAVLPALQAQGIAVVQLPTAAENTVSVETMFVHAESGEWLSSTLTLRPTKLDPQAAGSAITYARRYSLLAMVCAAAEDDDAGKASEPAKALQRAATVTPKPVAAKPAGQTDMRPWEMMQPPQRAQLFALVKKIGISDDDRYALCVQLGLPPTSKEFTKEHASKLIDYLENLDKPEPSPPDDIEDAANEYFEGGR